MHPSERRLTVHFKLVTTIPYAETPYAIAASDDGQWLGATSFDQKLRMYEAATMTERKKVHLGTSFPHACAFTADAVIAGGKTLSLFRLTKFKRAGKLKHRDEIQTVKVDKSSSRAVTGSGVNVVAADCSLRTWDLGSFEELSRWKLPSTVFGADITADGSCVVGVTQSGEVVCGSPGAKSPTWSTPWRPWIYSALFRGDEIWAGGDMHAIGVFRSDTGELLREIPTGGSTRQLAALDEEHVVLGTRSSNPARIHVLNGSGEAVWTSETVGRMVHGVAASPDGARIYAITSDPNALLVFERAEGAW